MNKMALLIQNKMSIANFVSNAFPMLCEWGVEDQDVMVHSLGVSAWNTLGHELGFMAVAECPAPFAAFADDIRSDSVWFDKTTGLPVVVIEFERYDGTEKGRQKMGEKAEHLLEANQRWGGHPQVLILASWSKGMVSVPDHRNFCTMIHQGFKNQKGTRVNGNPGAKFLFSRFCFQQQLQDKKLKLDRILFEA
ncbi:hypothetical protein HRM2_49020 [Desulforapulum autotrophicum HRM2]|uniref:Uncharacterized protein n=1 Tax=Desulforapulum autotrophicum (strain ATCC 43914 / DSM 3382 / VKM B-1955 / HRM2) TaxID=177437 RepID=C0QIK6_DESAH|nr:hypothetical protein [Desulforapulum autotrophicum]ACN17950.1 hypothetical protein HRM2_49020 [Desulforapulum autotrophicum HRM2]